ncbi:MAG: response regulator [Ignavibacteriales bacterium]|nr:response regulator [Ignavibacteriales bacterium]
MENKYNILIVDDEPQIRKILRITLESNSYKVMEAENGKDGIAFTAANKPNLIILDLGLPDQDGLSVLKNIREWSNIPVIILSVRNSEEDIVSCLDQGADDYLTKPFNTSELLARIRASLRRSAQVNEENVYSDGSLSIDLVSRTVKKETFEVKLTATEYDLLLLFVKNVGKVLTHRYILKEIWGPAYIEQSQYPRVFVGNLRKKIEDDPANPKYILTESGVGYRFVSIK